MTNGVLDRFPVARLAVAVTGIAGPGRRHRREAGRPDVRGGRRSAAARRVVERHTWPHDRDGNKRGRRASPPSSWRAPRRDGAGRWSTPGERIHVIGIAGSGAAGAAVLLHHAGAAVDGCDADAPSPYTPALDAAGIRWAAGHDPSHLDGVERVAITPALRAVPDHPELAAAERARASGRHLAGAARRADGGARDASGSA